MGNGSKNKICFLIKSDKLLEKHNEVWFKVSKLFKRI